MPKTKTRLHRVTDLFVTGREIVLEDDPTSEPILVWVAKLNAFQRGEAQRDGATAQARRAIGLTDESEEMQLARRRLDELDRDAVLDYLVQQKANELFLGAVDDVRADEDWAEKLAVIERGDDLEADGSPPSEAEAAQIAQLNVEYMTALNAAEAQRRQDVRKELDQLDDTELHKQFLDTWREQIAISAFMGEYERTQLYLATRDCEAIRDGNGGFDHTACTHPRLLPNRAAVAEMPDELADRVRRTLAIITAPPREAGNSAAPRTSSAPSEPPSTAEDSPVSSPTET